MSWSLLTPRERDVVRLVAQGYDGQGGARELGISYNRWRHVAQEVRRKLQIRHLADNYAGIWYWREGPGKQRIEARVLRQIVGDCPPAPSAVEVVDEVQRRFANEA